MIAAFNESAQVVHSGGKGSQREDIRASFLEDYLPKQYGVGRGEVISPKNMRSGQMDVVIYDAQKCPVLLPSTSHAVYPVESIYGVISVKSRLNSTELKDAYQNISSFKSVLPRESYEFSPAPGMAIGLSAPTPVTGIFAFTADRSLEAIAEQAIKLDTQYDLSQRPDFIAILGIGIVASREALRGLFNNYQPPVHGEKLRAIRKTGRHTLLRTYMELLRELNLINLRPFDLSVYDKMPKVLGNYRVARHDTFALTTNTNDVATPSRINKAGIDEIVSKSVPVTHKQHLMNSLGQLPLGSETIYDLEAVIYEYNPRCLPSLFSLGKSIRQLPNGEARWFYPIGIDVDGKTYAIDLFGLPPGCLEPNPDISLDELFAA